MYNKIERDIYMISEVLEIIDRFGTVFKALKLDLVLSIVINLIIIAVLFKLTDVFIKKLTNKFSSKDSSPLMRYLIPTLSKLTKFLILFFVIASFLQSNGYSITSLIAGFGITGLAVGFAAQQTIADFFGTITIITDKMFKIGDYVKIADTEGTVEDVNLFSTKIRTLDDFLVSVPNNNISGATVINMTKAHKRRINEVFGVTYSTDDEKLQQAIEIIKEVCKNHKDILDGETAFVETLSASSIDIRLLAYVKTNAYAKLAQVRSEVILEIVKRFREENIEFAFPSQSVYIEKQ